MDTTEYEKRQTRLQEATRDYVLRGDANAFLTLTFRSEYDVSYRYAEKVFGAFAHALKCHLYGKNSKKRIYMVPVIEGYSKDQQRTALMDETNERIHIHCLICFPGNPMDHMEKVRRIWVATRRACGNPNVYCPNNDKWFQELVTDESKRKVTEYVLKTCGQDIESVLPKFIPFRHVT